MNDLYVVRWMDACAFHGWEHTENKLQQADLMECWSVGKVIRENGKTITMAQSWSDVNDTVSDVIVIPKSWVVKKVKLHARTRNSKKSPKKT